MERLFFFFCNRWLKENIQTIRKWFLHNTIPQQTPLLAVWYLSPDFFHFFHKYILTTCYVLWASLVAQTVKGLPAMRETWVQFLGREDPLEKEMAIPSSTLAWKIPWTEEPGRLQSMGSQRVGHDWATSLIHYPLVTMYYAEHQALGSYLWTKQTIIPDPRELALCIYDHLTFFFNKWNHPVW